MEKNINKNNNIYVCNSMPSVLHLAYIIYLLYHHSPHKQRRPKKLILNKKYFEQLCRRSFLPCVDDERQSSLVGEVRGVSCGRILHDARK